DGAGVRPGVRLVAVVLREVRVEARQVDAEDMVVQGADGLVGVDGDGGRDVARFQYLDGEPGAAHGASSVSCASGHREAWRAYGADPKPTRGSAGGQHPTDQRPVSRRHASPRPRTRAVTRLSVPTHREATPPSGFSDTSNRAGWLRTG